MNINMPPPPQQDATAPSSMIPAESTHPNNRLERSQPGGNIEDSRCQTCLNRRYVDQSDDSGVSFQTPTRIKGDVAATVYAHEMEHATREASRAKQEDRRVILNSISLSTAVCPECGTEYISGGETRTMTVANNSESTPQEEHEEAVRQSFDFVV
ncbi:MAG: hypothetical protein FWG65_02580 [Turicibacter sp.]|nr:hypothetical protein [Turicibacter sp.]